MVGGAIISKVIEIVRNHYIKYYVKILKWGVTFMPGTNNKTGPIIWR